MMSESLRNDGRIWVPKKPGDARRANDIPEEERDYYLERRYPAFGNLVPRDVASRAAKERCDAGYGVGSSKQAVYLDYADAIKRYGTIECNKMRIKNPTANNIRKLGIAVVKEKYGNLFDMYKGITGEDPYEVPMRIYPAVHYTMGGLWVDYELMTTVKGLYVLGEANFSDNGANRLGANALLQALADGYFIIPYTIGNYLANEIGNPAPPVDHPAFEEAEKNISNHINRLMNINGTRSVTDFHRQLGKIMWNKCGMLRNAQGLQQAIQEVKQLKEEFWMHLKIPGAIHELNPELEKALRLADFMELAELICVDALHRNESAGGHFREEFQTQDGEAVRNDSHYMYVGVWEYKGDHEWELHKEHLKYEEVKATQRSYQ